MSIKYIHQVCELDELVHFEHDFEVPPINDMTNIKDIKIPLILKATLFLAKKPDGTPSNQGEGDREE